MAIKMLLLAVVAYLGMAAYDLPGLWGRRGRRGEFWTVISLLGIGFILAVAVILGYSPISAFDLIEAVFKPVGTLLFKAKEG